MPTPFKWILTEDGSPSLNTGYGEHAEAMHSQAGAFTESLEIYDRATALVMRENWPGHYLSVGLGLGYNEIILGAHALSENKDHILTLTSLETEKVLVEQIENWLTSVGSDDQWAAAYNKISALAEKQFSLEPGSVRLFLEELYRQGKWYIGGELSRAYQFEKPASAIFYDAFSSKSCPDLWTEELLGHLLNNGAAEQCAFTTYAFTGSLKRALATTGFEQRDRPGFAGKRLSTFAIRESYSNSIER